MYFVKKMLYFYYIQNPKNYSQENEAGFIQINRTIVFGSNLIQYGGTLVLLPHI